MKSERLKKLEKELVDLEEWLKLGLVPQKDIEKHKKEISAFIKKIEEEKKRLELLKEDLDGEELSTQKKGNNQRQIYQEPHTLDGDNLAEDDLHDEDHATSSYQTHTQAFGSDRDSVTISDEDPFSDKNRWRRGILEDPDADSW